MDGQINNTVCYITLSQQQTDGREGESWQVCKDAVELSWGQTFHLDPLRFDLITFPRFKNSCTCVILLNLFYTHTHTHTHQRNASLSLQLEQLEEYKNWTLIICKGKRPSISLQPEPNTESFFWIKNIQKSHCGSGQQHVPSSTWTWTLQILYIHQVNQIQSIKSSFEDICKNSIYSTLSRTNQPALACLNEPELHVSNVSLSQHIWFKWMCHCQQSLITSWSFESGGLRRGNVSGPQGPQWRTRLTDNPYTLLLKWNIKLPLQNFKQHEMTEMIAAIISTQTKGELLKHQTCFICREDTPC